MSSAVEQPARNQVVFRGVNERIAELTLLLSETGRNEFLCECSDPACVESLEVTPQEYEAVRADPARFVVLGGHELPEVERVVDGNGRYLVVEKFGAAAEIARAGDPRRAGPAPRADSRSPDGARTMAASTGAAESQETRQSP